MDPIVVYALAFAMWPVHVLELVFFPWRLMSSYLIGE